jgi:hypothetical protein
MVTVVGVGVGVGVGVAAGVDPPPPPQLASKTVPVNKTTAASHWQSLTFSTLCLFVTTVLPLVKPESVIGNFVDQQGRDMT